MRSHLLALAVATLFSANVAADTYTGGPTIAAGTSFSTYTSNSQDYNKNNTITDLFQFTVAPGYTAVMSFFWDPATAFTGGLSVAVPGLTLWSTASSIPAAGIGATLLGDPLGAGSYYMTVVMGKNPAGTGKYTFKISGTGTAVTPVPEPESWAMFLAGMGVVGVIVRRRRIHAEA